MLLESSQPAFGNCLPFVCCSQCSGEGLSDLQHPQRLLLLRLPSVPADGQWPDFPDGRYCRHAGHRPRTGDLRRSAAGIVHGTESCRFASQPEFIRLSGMLILKNRLSFYSFIIILRKLKISLQTIACKCVILVKSIIMYSNVCCALSFPLPSTIMIRIFLSHVRNE